MEAFLLYIKLGWYGDTCDAIIMSIKGGLYFALILG
jgi:hypothetical protein